MKKLSLSIIALMVIVLVSGCGKQSETDTKQMKKVESSNETATNENKDETSTTEKLTAWLTKGTAVECTVSSKEGEVRVKVKGDKARIEGMAMSSLDFTNKNNEAEDQQTKNGTMINDGEWVYMWTDKTGLKFNAKEMEEKAKQNSDNLEGVKDDFSWKEWAKDEEANSAKYDCQEADLADSVFIAPTDVKFMDLNEQLKAFENMGKNLEQKFENLPKDLPTEFMQ